MIEFINPFALVQRIKRPLILDGAMGSLLQQRGYKVNNDIWTTKLNQSIPEIIINIHRSYIDAGADIITTNTFRTNTSSLERVGINQNKKFVRQAVNLAKAAKGDLPIFIAGSNAPAEDCYQRLRNLTKKELQVNHYNHIDLLYDNGVHFVLNETQSHFDEIKIICHYCSKNSIPYVVSLYSVDGRTILSGESLADVFHFIEEHEPLSIGINCISPKIFKTIVKNINTEFAWGFYLNCGAGLKTDRKLKSGITPNDYSLFVTDCLKKNPAFIGACCGSTPEHIRAIKRLVDGFHNS